MQATSRLNGMAIAAAAAAVFALTPLAAVAAERQATGHCMGANACKGHSECKTATSECKGHNSCKGKGFVGATKEECAKLGGKYEEAKS